MRAILVGVAALAFLGSASAQDAKKGASVYVDAAAKKLPYRLQLPPNLDATKKYPLIVFLHGAGERGDDGMRQLAHFAFALNQPKVREAHPAFLLAPQCPTNAQWVSMPWGPGVGKRPEQPSEPMRLTFELIEQTLREHPIDPDRVYATGLSMGGFGVWDMLTRRPDRFAAGFAICGGGDPASVTAASAKIPVWAFHSIDDGAVKVDGSRRMTEAWKHAGGSPHYTEWKNRGHGIWTAAWSDAEALPWLLSQRRGQPDAYAFKTLPKDR